MFHLLHRLLLKLPHQIIAPLRRHRQSSTGQLNQFPKSSAMQRIVQLYSIPFATSTKPTYVGPKYPKYVKTYFFYLMDSNQVSVLVSTVCLICLILSSVHSEIVILFCYNLNCYFIFLFYFPLKVPNFNLNQ